MCRRCGNRKSSALSMPLASTCKWWRPIIGSGTSGSAVSCRGNASARLVDWLRRRRGPCRRQREYVLWAMEVESLRTHRKRGKIEGSDERRRSREVRDIASLAWRGCARALRRNKPQRTKRLTPFDWNPLLSPLPPLSIGMLLSLLTLVAPALVSASKAPSNRFAKRNIVRSLSDGNDVSFEYFFDQLIDHTNPSLGTFKQRVCCTFPESLDRRC